MRKCIKIVVMFIWVAVVYNSVAQTSQKQLVVFTDRNSCISGDTLLFKVWVPQELDTLGNVIHVQLDNGSGNVISSVAVKSENGMAEGYIFIPDSLSTGLFYLSSFLNAQRANPEIKTIGKALYVYNRFAENINQLPVPAAGNFKQIESEIPDFEITLDKQSYVNREKVSGSIIVPHNLVYAHVTAKVVDPFTKNNSGFIEFLLSPEQFKIPVFPEKDGVLISGTIRENGEAPQSRELVLLSITGEPPYFDYYYSEPDGNFHFFLKDAEGAADVILQTVGTSSTEYEILHRKNTLTQKNTIREDTVFLKPGEYEFVENTLKNSFFKKLFNTGRVTERTGLSMPIPFDMPFYGPPTRRVVPDEFFDLPDFKEISRELLHGVQYRTPNDEITFRMLNLDQGSYFDNEPLRLLNGIPVFKNSFLAALKSADIRYIDIVQSERIFGDLHFKGVLAVLLNDHSNSWLAQQPNVYQFSIPCLQVKNTVSYEQKPELNETTPDVRTNYLWKTIPVGKTTEFSFYLSDLKGEIEISVEGITEQNQIFKSSKIIEVK